MKQVQTKFVLSDICTGGNDEPVLACPVCGFHCVHPEKVEVIQNKSRVIVTKDGAQLVPHDEPVWNRGSVTVQWFWCEDGHHFAYEYAFHKGSVYVTLRSEESVGTEPSLWRD